MCPSTWYLIHIVHSKYNQLGTFYFQVNPEKYHSLGTGFRLTYQEGGARNLMLGWAPTALGYAAQGNAGTKQALDQQLLTKDC